MKHIIDTDKSPSIPDGFTIEEHIKGGKIDLSKVELWLSDEQKTGYITGHKLRKKVKNPLNACVLDYLLEHQELIPDEWKGKIVSFFGTVYRRADGRLYVRYLYWNGGRWGWGYFWLGSVWHVYCPALVPASPKSSKSKSSALDSLELRVSNLESKLDKVLEALK